MKKSGKYISAMILAFALVFVVGCAAPEKQETVGEYIDDSVVTTRAKAAILDDPALRVNEISVETFDGVVQLSGFVSSQAEINRAVQLVRSVNGVQSVKNDMRVK
jgi:osmotically-inducible protein OsmY